jgi:hypothetical protein
MALTIASRPAWAHNVTFGQSKIVQDGEVVRYELAVEYEVLVQRVTGMEGSDRWTATGTDEELKQELVERKGMVERALLSDISISHDGVGCDGSVEELDVILFQEQMYAFVSLLFDCAGSPSGSYEIHYDLLFDRATLSRGVAHVNMAEYSFGENEGREVFEPKRRQLVVGANLFSSPMDLIVLGVEHLLTGISTFLLHA